MSIPPHREPFLLNKFLDAETQPDYEFRRPCLGSTNYCDYEYFHRMDAKNPFCDSRFPRYKHSDFLYKLPKEAVLDTDTAGLSPRALEKNKWGLRISNKHAEWRSSFPDRFPRLEGNEADYMVSGPQVYKPSLESIRNGKTDLSFRRLRYMENTKGGKIFETRARDEKWDRYREGAGPITRTVTFAKDNKAPQKAPWSTFRIPGQKQKSVPNIKFWSESERMSSHCESDVISATSLGAPPTPGGQQSAKGSATPGGQQSAKGSATPGGQQSTKGSATPGGQSSVKPINTFGCTYIPRTPGGWVSDAYNSNRGAPSERSIAQMME